jgi:hypothetical protein
MNYKKTSKATGVDKLYKELDTIVKVEDDALDTRAAQVEAYASDMTKLIDDGKSTTQDLLDSIDEMLDQDKKTAIMQKLSEKFDLPESLDENIHAYITNCKVDEMQALKFILTCPELSDEDCVILVDEILSAYE